MSQKRASADALDRLHAQVADVLTASLRGDEVSPQMIAQAIKFLQVNGIDAPAAVKNARTEALAKELQDLSVDLDDEARRLAN